MKKSLFGLVLFIGLVLAAVAAENEWVSLFDGKTLAGWVQKNGTAVYRAEDGMIVGRTAKGSPNSFLCTEKEYGDFELEFDVKVDNALNSGVQLRSRTKTEQDVGGGKKQVGNDVVGRVFGPQVEIAAGGAEGSLSGYIYGEGLGHWLTSADRLKQHNYFKKGEWNHFRVLAQGPRIQTWLNGEKIDDLTDEADYKTFPKGFLGLQVHGIGNKDLPKPLEAAWKNIRIRELK